MRCAFLRSQNRRTLRIALQVMVWLFLTLGFALTATATPLPPSATSPLLVRQAVTPTATANRIVPTPQPPNRSPQSVPGQPQVDANTIALYHFDVPDANNALDATGMYTATLQNGASIASTGLFGGVLTLNGNGQYLQTGYLNTLDLSQGTIDGYFDLLSQCEPSPGVEAPASFPLITGWDASTGQVVLRLRASGYLIFEVLTPTGWETAISGVNPCRYMANAQIAATNLGQPPNPVPVKWPYEAWRFHHIAVTWGPRGVEIWLDGVLHGVGVTNVTPEPAINNFANYYNYWCNPQDQLNPSNIYYQNCPKPTVGLVPNMGYGGGIHSYTNFLVGTDGAGNYFAGRIDELRFSNNQRIFQWTVVPTLTPTPTNTPDAPSGEYALDPQTEALYHFDSQSPNRVVTDATGQYNGYFSGNAAYVPNGRYYAGLQVDGTTDGGGYYAYAAIPNGIYNYPSGSIEAWVNLSNASSPFQVIYSGSVYLGMPVNSNTIRFGVVHGASADTAQLDWADSGVTASSLVGCWHFIAGTWGNRGIEVWVDGVLKATNGVTAKPFGDYSTYAIGCNPALGQCTKGIIDEVRLSTIQRTFAPPQKLASRSSPQNSLDLWNLYFPFVSKAPVGPVCPF